MLEIKSGLAIVSGLIALLAYIPYFRDILHKKTRPHAFSWLVWGTMSTVAFFAQYGDGGGAGTWVLAFTALADLGIFFLALSRGESTISKLDWLCLSGAMIGMALFTFNEDPPMSLFIVSSVYIIGFIPTVRKSILKPQQETATTYVMNVLKYAFAIAALENFTLVTLLYPLVVAGINAFFVGLLIVMRNRLGYGLRKRTKTLKKSAVKAATAKPKRRP